MGVVSEGLLEGKKREKKVRRGDMQKCFPGRRVDEICVCVGINFSRFPGSAKRMVEIVPST